MFEEGQKLAAEVGVYNLPSEIYQTLGRFKFRTSFGQNLVVHTLEETKIGIQIAHEIGADVNNRSFRLSLSRHWKSRRRRRKSR